MANERTFIVAAKRSGVGRFLGSLSNLAATDVGAQVAKAVIADSKVDVAAIDEVIVGQVLQGGCGQNPARQVALGAGVPDTISCCTVNKVCGSGLQSSIYADQIIRSGDADIILSGGIESMSQAPFLVRNVRQGHKFGTTEFVDLMLHDGLTNVYDGSLMGEIAEYTAEKAGVTRQQQDEWALRSHQLAAKADAAGLFNDERAPIELPRGKGQFCADETYRADVTMEGLSGLRPAFTKNGTVTAGNASSLSDGAAIALLASAAGAKKAGLTPLAQIAGSATAGGPPRELFFTPIAATRMACEKAGWTLDSVDLFELNEAFASQSIACLNGLEVDPEKVNVHGGAIALGHPIGASGARVLTTLLHALKTRGGKRGVTALCLGGGNSVAMAVEMV